MSSCSKCGIELLEGAKFCIECGAEVIQMVEKPICNHCGIVLHEVDKFCLECGTKVEVVQKEVMSRAKSKTKRKRSTASKSKRKRSIASKSQQKKQKKGSFSFVNLILFIGVVLTAYYFFFYDEETPLYSDTSRNYEQIDVPPSKVKPEKVLTFDDEQSVPTKVLSTDNGAVITVPERKAAGNGEVEISERAPNENERKAGITNEVIVFNNWDDKKIEGELSVDLPKGRAGKEVLVKSAMGWWIPLPHEEIVLDNGEKGMRVIIENETTPLEFSVVNSSISKDLLPKHVNKFIAYEQRMLTDKNGADLSLLLDDEIAHNKLQTGSFFSLFSNSNEEKNNYNEHVRLYHRLRSFSLGDKSNMSYDEKLKEYKACLELMHKYRKQEKVNYSYWFREMDHYSKDDGNVLNDHWELKRILTFRSNHDMINYLGSLYAPWGIDLTLDLLNFQQSNYGLIFFDLDVLSPIGQKPWFDFPLSAKDIPHVIKGKYYEKYASNYITGKYQKRGKLRMYSSRAVNMDWYHYFAKTMSDVVLRWGPVVAGAASLVYTGGVSALLSYPLAINFSWALAEQLIQDGTEHYSDNTQLYTAIEYSTVGSEKLAKKVMIKLGDKATAGKLSVDMKGKNAGYGQAILSLGCAWYLHYRNDAEMTRLKKLTSSRNGYLGSQVSINTPLLHSGLHIPPIEFIAELAGQTVPEGDHYNGNMYKVGIFPLQVDQIYSEHLNTLLGKQELKKKSTDLYSTDNRVWRHYKTTTIKNSYEPQKQLIRINLSKELIKDRVATFSIPDQKWEKVALSDLGLIIRIRSISGDFTKYIDLYDVTTKVDITNGYRSALVQMNFGEFIMSQPEFPNGFIPQLGSYQKESTYARTKYKVDIGFVDYKRNYHPFSETSFISFENAIDRFATGSNVLGKLKNGEAVEYWSRHIFIDAEDFYLRWNILNSHPLLPLRKKEIEINGFVYEPDLDDNSELKGLKNKEVVVQFMGKTYTDETDKNGFYSIKVPCLKGEIKVQSIGITKTKDITECTSHITVDIIAEDLGICKKGQYTIYPSSNESIEVKLITLSEQIDAAEIFIGKSLTPEQKENVASRNWTTFYDNKTKLKELLQPMCYDALYNRRLVLTYHGRYFNSSTGRDVIYSNGYKSKVVNEGKKDLPTGSNPYGNYEYE
ncbi:MAG: zinc ribbon domain-containing protein [Saprospiraceae bacterium]|nr:zinc ribbon domain-containing protein [Saprospiraceae bacterium]